MSNPSIKHVAIIMDGNGRWAKLQNKIREMGHIAGVKTLGKFIGEFEKTKIDFLTVYAFSTENWQRPKKEVKRIMKLTSLFANDVRKFCLKNKINFNILGELKNLSETVQKSLIKMSEENTSSPKFTVNLAFNYGAKRDIINAIKKIVNDNKDPKTITEESFSKYLSTTNIPPVDILIRTGGQKRISNFLLWESAYAELFFIEKLWPDFNIEDLEKIIEKFNKRTRNFGKI